LSWRWGIRLNQGRNPVLPIEGEGEVTYNPVSGTTTANWDCRWQDYFRLSRPSRSGRWKAAHAKIVSEPEDKPWKLREFMVVDLDGNLIRVFYDFRDEM
jgi:hypothetical protein